ncbi:ArdC-like ssDNA-binding domain-containing protein, partial [Romboutsia sp. MSSM.1001216sp_RTP31141st1_G3_RTP31141_220114]
LKDFGRTFSNDFKERQLDFLRNTSSAFDIELVEVDNVDSMSNSKELVDRAYRKKVKNTKEEYKKETTKETVDDIIKATNEKLNSYFESPKHIKKYLSYMAKFYKYSIGNCSMIEKQFKGAIAVGSFKFWKDNGFTVNKGEKGIQILVPTPVKNFYDEETHKR